MSRGRILLPPTQPGATWHCCLSLSTLSFHATLAWALDPLRFAPPPCSRAKHTEAALVPLPCLSQSARFTPQLSTCSAAPCPPPCSRAKCTEEDLCRRPHSLGMVPSASPHPVAEHFFGPHQPPCSRAKCTEEDLVPLPDLKRRQGLLLAVAPALGGRVLSQPVWGWPAVAAQGVAGCGAEGLQSGSPPGSI